MKGAVLSFQAHLCSSDDKLSNGAKIAAIYLVFTFRILRNSYKRCAIIIVLFTMGGVIAMETECLWLLFGDTNITFARPKSEAVSNQNNFKTPCMHTF